MADKEQTQTQALAQEDKLPATLKEDETSKQEPMVEEDSKVEEDAAESTPKQKKPVPVPTLYVRNLNDKVKVEEMRLNLYMLFSSFGEVIQVRMRATQQLRGQAFVVFKEQSSADRALSSLQAINIFSSPMTIEYARSFSDETRRQQHEKAQQQIMEGVLHATSDKGQSLSKVTNERRRKRQQKHEAKRTDRREKLLKTEEGLRKQKEEQAVEHEAALLDAKKREEAELAKKQAAAAQQEESKATVQPEQPVTKKRVTPARANKNKPTNMIQIENLPVNFSRLMLEELTKNYPGVDSIVEMDGPDCRAVIKFDSADQAKFAVMGLNRFRADQSGRELRVNFFKTQQ